MSFVKSACEGTLNKFLESSYTCLQETERKQWILRVCSGNQRIGFYMMGTLVVKV